jgi:acetyltransferase-like isoleucine patch superfamily enzyme
MGGLRIGNDVRIAAHCVVIPANHIYEDPDRPICRQGLTKSGIVIGDDVWIGTNVTILDGTNIGKGAVIAAGAVVRGNLDPMTVYAGVPAHCIKTRKRSVPD